MPDPHHLQRFVEAQAPIFERVLDELKAAQKRTHWMWFIFPQIEGLGHSAMARHYAIQSLTEAQAYLDHPLLGPRLLQCTTLVNQIQGRSATEIFGSPDDLKFRSCMTLFGHVQAKCETKAPPHVFATALDTYFAGNADPTTLQVLQSQMSMSAPSSSPPSSSPTSSHR